MTVIIDIPLHSYLKKYVKKRFSTNEPLAIGNDSLLGKLVIKNFQDGIKRSPRKKTILNDHLAITVDITYFGKKGLVITHDNIYDLNCIIDEIFKKELGKYIGLMNGYSAKSRKACILKFLKGFHISEDEINLFSIIKHFQRHPEDTETFEYQLKK